MREKHHGPPPTDRKTLVHDPDGNRWAICTPGEGGGFTLSWPPPWDGPGKFDEWPGFLWYDLPGVYREATVSAAADSWTYRATKDGPTATPPADSQPGYPRVCEVFVYPHQSPPLFGVATVGGVRQFPADVARRVLQMHDGSPMRKRLEQLCGDARTGAKAAAPSSLEGAIFAGKVIGLQAAIEALGDIGEPIRVGPAMLKPGRYRSPDGVEGGLYPFDDFAGCYRFAPDGYVPPAVVGNGTTDGLIRFGKDATAGWVRLGDSD